MSQQPPKPNHLLVAVITTAGAYPTNDADGFAEVPINQPVKVTLDKAAAELGLSGTGAWIATVGTTELRANQSYSDHGLSGSVQINWGPREGGGGAR